MIIVTFFPLSKNKNKRPRVQVERENKGRGKFFKIFFGINIVFLHQRLLKICEYHFIDIIFIDSIV